MARSPIPPAQLVHGQQVIAPGVVQRVQQDVPHQPLRHLRRQGCHLPVVAGLDLLQDILAHQLQPGAAVDRKSNV